MDLKTTSDPTPTFVPTIAPPVATDSARPVLRNFVDYRAYLKAFYDYKVATSASALRPYSYGQFSAAADIKSPNYLKLIIENQRNLSADMARKFARALALSKTETDEFLVLVAYNQAKDTIERNRYLKRLNELRVQQQIEDGAIDSTTWDKVPDWITWVVYHMLDQKNVTWTEEEVAKLFPRQVALSEVKMAIARLVNNSVVSREPNGSLKKKSLLMPGSEAIPTELVRKLQAELIYLGLESLYRDEQNQRELGGMTMALTQEEFEQVRFELRQLRKRWYKDFGMKREQEKGDRVYQINLQVFPLTRESSP